MKHRNFVLFKSQNFRTMVRRLLVLTLLLVSLNAFSQNNAIQALQKIERERFAAMVSKDFTYLEKVLHRDLLYTHSNGLQETKEEHISNIKSGKLIYQSIEPEEVNVRLFRKSAVVNGHIRVKVVLDGRDVNIRLRYLNMYVKTGDGWQLVAWQSARTE
jgi:hypothetical protein